MQGIFCTALLSDAVSVYIFHDVDKDMIGRWNEAFAGLWGESILFTLAIGVGVAVLTWIGRLIFRFKGHPPRAKLGLFLGVVVSVLQYPWDFVGRVAFPKFADTFLSVYVIVAIFICSIVIVHDSYRRRKLGHAQAVSFDG
jgi:hypothetical protein